MLRSQMSFLALFPRQQIAYWQQTAISCFSLKVIFYWRCRDLLPNPHSQAFDLLPAAGTRPADRPQWPRVAGPGPPSAAEGSPAQAPSPGQPARGTQARHGYTAPQPAWDSDSFQRTRLTVLAKVLLGLHCNSAAQSGFLPFPIPFPFYSLIDVDPLYKSCTLSSISALLPESPICNASYSEWSEKADSRIRF